MAKGNDSVERAMEQVQLLDNRIMLFLTDKGGRAARSKAEAIASFIEQNQRNIFKDMAEQALGTVKTPAAISKFGVNWEPLNPKYAKKKPPALRNRFFAYLYRDYPEQSLFGVLKDMSPDRINAVLGKPKVNAVGRNKPGGIVNMKNIHGKTVSLVSYVVTVFPNLTTTGKLQASIGNLHNDDILFRVRGHDVYSSPAYYEEMQRYKQDHPVRGPQAAKALKQGKYKPSAKHKISYHVKFTTQGRIKRPLIAPWIAHYLELMVKRAKTQFTEHKSQKTGAIIGGPKYNYAQVKDVIINHNLNYKYNGGE